MKNFLMSFIILCSLCGCAKRVALMDYSERMKLIQQLDQKCRSLGLTDKKQIEECIVTEIQVRENRIVATSQALQGVGRGMQAASADRSVAVYGL